MKVIQSTLRSHNLLHIHNLSLDSSLLILSCTQMRIVITNVTSINNNMNLMR